MELIKFQAVSQVKIEYCYFWMSILIIIIGQIYKSKVLRMNETSNFTLEEIGDLLRNKENLIYLFQLNCYVNRIFAASKENDNNDIS